MAGTSILVVDGDEGERTTTKRALEARGFTVHASDTAAEAQQLLKSRRVACVVLDAELPDARGLAAVDRLRSIVPGLPVIVTARRNTRELEARVRRCDVVYYHVKSFGPDELVQAVERATGGRDMKAKILVVDDEQDYQAAMRHILEGAGYEVVSSLTKEDGLARLRGEAPDLVILDIMMTKTTDGFHFLYEMKADGERDGPPVLSISVISEETGFQFSPTTDGDFFPADDFLTKPVDPAELLSHVEDLLAGKRPVKGE